jgi:hypothetical protein
VYGYAFDNWTDGKPNGWEAQTSTQMVQYTPAYSGSYACKVVSATQGARIYTTETFPVYWGKKYVLTFVAKLIKGSYIEMSISNNTSDNYYSFTRFSKRINIGEEWQRYEIEFIPASKSSNSFNGMQMPISNLENYLSITVRKGSVTVDSVEFVIDNIKLVAKDHTMEFDYLDVNNMKAYIDPIAPFLNWNWPLMDINYLEVPKNSKKTTIFTSNLWMGSLDVQDQLHIAAQLFCQHGFDFWVGPISADYTMVADTLGGDLFPYYRQVYSDEYIQKYHHTWKVSKAEINYHKAHYAESGYVMPWSIAHWPAHGRTEHGESANLAPFKSVSGNTVYNPSQGDYPDIRGDQAVFFIINDMGGEHLESNAEKPLGIEILGMAYAFNSTNEALQNTIFLSYNIYNKSANHYKDFYFGYWSDFDIGYTWDDYIGCDTLLNLMYGYNGEEIDGNEEPEAYGVNPPAQGAMFLNQKMNAFADYGKISPNWYPYVAMDYYNYLRAICKDGTPLTMWGNGYNPVSTDYTRFMFSGDPIEKTGWTEFTPNGSGSEPNTPRDINGMMSAGPFTFSAGGSISFDIALPFARSSGNLASVALLKEYAAEIQKYYDEIILEIKENKDKKGKLLVYPNPSNGQFTLSSEQVIEYIELYDMLGKSVFTATPKDFTTQINTRLPQGLYIYRAVLQDHTIASGKIIVQ